MISVVSVSGPGNSVRLAPQCVKHWPSDLTVPGSSPIGAKFSRPLTGFELPKLRSMAPIFLM